ncbi:hypothetical protein JL722_678 [Aureococcus anophagefferens]|nr:hypothetical protein JL722_678 [Aureococcus anophagefferens]
MKAPPLADAAEAPFAGVRWRAAATRHYGKCKHSLAWAISQGEMTVPIYRIDRIGDASAPAQKAKGGEALSQMD